MINFYYFHGFYYIYGWYNKNNNNSTATMILYLESGPDRASLYVNITALYLHTEIVCYSALKEY